MHNYQGGGQFRPPFSPEVLREGESALPTQALHTRKNDAPTSFNPRLTMQSLPGLYPVQAQTKPCALLQPAQWRRPLVPVTPRNQRSTSLYSCEAALRERKKSFWQRDYCSLLIAVICFFWMSIRAAAPDVTLYQVSEQNVTQYSGGGGMVFPRQQFTLSYPVVEYAVEVLVKVGDQVSPNQPLLKLDPTRLNAQINSYQMTLLLLRLIFLVSRLLATLPVLLKHSNNIRLPAINIMLFWQSPLPFYCIMAI